MQKNILHLHISPEESDHAVVGIISKVLVDETSIFNHKAMWFSLVDLHFEVLIRSIEV